jgi:HK97 family phage major capsid protein
MPSAKLARLQDESVAIATEIETLRSYEATDDADKSRAEARMIELSDRADKSGAEAKAERELDARLEALRSIRTSDSDARKGNRDDEAVELRDKANHSIAGGLRGFTSRKAANAVGEYLRQVVTGECRAMGETSSTYDAKGVDFVMGELYGAVVNRLTYSSVGLQLASVYTPNADRITVPKIGDATVSIVAEGSATSDQDLSTSGAEVRLYEHRLSIAISRSLLEDSPLDVAGTIADRIGVAYAKQVDSIWLGGNASSPTITGLAASVAAGNTITVGASAATTVNNLADVVGKVDEAVMGTGAWVCSRAGWVDLMKLWSAQQTTMTVGGDRVVPTIFGAPVYLVKGLPATTLALYGDYKLSSAIAVKANGLEIEVGRELLIRQRQVLYAACQRVGVSNHDAQYVGRLAKASS